jgi:hydrogenase expression/formation protein HypE
MDNATDFAPACPIPMRDHPRVTLAHGGGGRLMTSLIEKMFLPAFDNPELRSRHDGAVLDMDTARVAFTTDSYVVRPLVFPGGDIGSLAVHGTVNDLLMCGARPVALSAALVIEEGLAMEELWRVVHSMQHAAAAAGVAVVTGDTKVVEKGKGDGVYINTAGVGVVPPGRDIRPARVRPGDVIVLSGDVGRHGIAIMAAREGLELETPIESDSAALAGPVGALFDGGAEVHCLRDLTRGGLAAALIEIAHSAGVHIEVDETAVAVRDDVRGACEILGLDPLFVANEGRFVAFVPESQAERALSLLRHDALSAGAAVIGGVEKGGALVTTRTAIGTTSVLDLPSGEQLPRIC